MRPNTSAACSSTSRCLVIHWPIVPALPRSRIYYSDQNTRARRGRWVWAALPPKNPSPKEGSEQRRVQCCRPMQNNPSPRVGAVQCSAACLPANAKKPSPLGCSALMPACFCKTALSHGGVQCSVACLPMQNNPSPRGDACLPANVLTAAGRLTGGWGAPTPPSGGARPSWRLGAGHASRQPVWGVDPTPGQSTAWPAGTACTACVTALSYYSALIRSPYLGYYCVTGA